MGRPFLLTTSSSLLGLIALLSQTLLQSANAFTAVRDPPRLPLLPSDRRLFRALSDTTNKIGRHLASSLSSSSSSSDDDFGSFSSGDNNKDDSSLFDMKSLQNRMAQVQDSDTKLPIIVLDTMLPRQTLKIEVENDTFQALVKHVVERETRTFGMVGVATLATTGDTVPLQNGVEVEIVGTPHVVEGQAKMPDGSPGKALRIQLVARRRFRINQEELTTTPQGWTAARVQFLDATTQERQEHDALVESRDPLSLARAIQQAAQLTKADNNLVEKWIALARTHQQFEGQIDRILNDLGPMPPPEEPSNRAFWVGALINPLPGMG